MAKKTITAYCVKTKQKGVPMQNAIITKTERGVYMAKGDDGKGNSMVTMLSEEKALAAINSGEAQNGMEETPKKKVVAKAAPAKVVVKKK